MKKNINETDENAIKTSIGGQALLEGIMMRGPKRTTMAVRNSQGEIVTETWETYVSKRAKITKLPFIRGIFNFVDSMKIGYKALMRSAEISGLEEAEAELEKEKAEKRRAKEAKKAAKNGTVIPETPETETVKQDNAEEPVAQDTDTVNVSENEVKNEKPKAEPDKKGSATTAGIMVVSTILGIGLAVLLFVYAPTLVSSWILGKNAASEHPVLLSVISGVIKVIILVGYMTVVSFIPDIRRTFMYHGAEHKTIFCYEHGKELTVENVRNERRFHPRCGTSFLFLMVIVSVIVMIPVGLLLRIWLPASVLATKWLYTLIRTLIAILFIPIFTGIGYETIKLAGRHENVFTKAVSAPGLWLQRITTKEPEDGMIECAITALKDVIPDDASDRW